MSKDKKTSNEEFNELLFSRQLFDSISDMVFFKDLKGRYIFVNKSFENIISLQKKDILGKTDHDLWKKEEASLITSVDKKVFKTKKSQFGEYEIYCKEGKLRTFESNKVPIFNEKDEIVGVAGISRDITQRKQSQKDLLASYESQKDILNNVPFMAWIKDTDSKYIYLNESYAKLCNVDMKTAIGKSDFEIHPYELALAYKRDDTEVVKTRKKFRIEEPIQTATGRKWFEVYKSPLIDGKGNVFGVTGFARDITEQKKLDLMKSEFIALLSKQLKAPLNSIKGSLKLILSGALTSELTSSTKNLIKIADESTSRLINLVDDILDIEKIEEGTMKFNIGNYKVNELIEIAIQNVKKEVENTDKNVIAIEPMADDVIQVDKKMFIQVIENLIKNGLSFTPQGTNVEVEVSKKNNHIRISVKDYGPGIPENMQQIVFNKYAQSYYSKKRKNGSGFELSLAKAILQRMKGYINFSSKADLGTTFYVEIPVYEL